MAKTMRARKVAEPEMNMTPMIDVTFQLLIFFLLGAKIRQPEGRLDAFLPPEGGPEKNKIDKVEDVRITIRNLGASEPDVMVELGEKRARGTKLLFPQDETLKNLRAGQQDLGLVIVSEGSIKFHWIIRALNAAARAGYEKISFAAPIPEALSPAEIRAGKIVKPIEK
jgi:biopolymer transport protein ExbD